MSTNEGDCAVNPPRDNLLKYSFSERFVLLFAFSFSGNVFHSDFFDNFLAIYPSIAVATSALTLSKLHSIISRLLSSKLLIRALNKFRFSTSVVSFSVLRPSFQKLICPFINALLDKIPFEFITFQGPLKIGHHSSGYIVNTSAQLSHFKVYLSE